MGFCKTAKTITFTGCTGGEGKTKATGTALCGKRYTAFAARRLVSGVRLEFSQRSTDAEEAAQDHLHLLRPFRRSNILS